MYSSILMGVARGIGTNGVVHVIVKRIVMYKRFRHNLVAIQRHIKGMT